jgi:PAS domain S-box-containing protein
MQSLSEPAHWMAVSLSSDGLITSISSAAEQLTGYSARELVGRPVTVILGDRSVFEISQIMKSALDWGLWEGEIVHRNRSGKPLRARSTLAQLTSHQNDCAGFLLLSDLKPRTVRDAAAGPQGDVAAYLRQTSHELNNPLAVMMGFAQLILLDPHCEGKIRSDVERVYSETKRIIQIVERMHSYAMSLQETHAELEQVRMTS